MDRLALSDFTSAYFATKPEEAPPIGYHSNWLVKWILHTLGFAVDLTYKGKTYCVNRSSLASFMSTKYQHPGVDNSDFRKKALAQIDRRASEAEAKPTEIGTFIETVAGSVEVPISETKREQLLKGLERVAKDQSESIQEFVREAREALEHPTVEVMHLYEDALHNLEAIRGTRKPKAETEQLLKNAEAVIEEARKLKVPTGPLQRARNQLLLVYQRGKKKPFTELLRQLAKEPELHKELEQELYSVNDKVVQALRKNLQAKIRELEPRAKKLLISLDDYKAPLQWDVKTLNFEEIDGVKLETQEALSALDSVKQRCTLLETIQTVTKKCKESLAALKPYKQPIASRNDLERLLKEDLKEATNDELKSWLVRARESVRQAKQDVKHLKVVETTDEASDVDLEDLELEDTEDIQSIASRNAAHSPDVAREFGVGVVNPGNGCYAISVLQALRIAGLGDVLQEKLGDAEAKAEVIRWQPRHALHNPLAGLQQVVRLDKAAQIELFDAMKAVIDIPRDKKRQFTELLQRVRIADEAAKRQFDSDAARIRNLSEGAFDEAITLQRELFQSDEQNLSTRQGVNPTLLFIANYFLKEGASSKKRAIDLTKQILELRPSRIEALQACMNRHKLPEGTKMNLLSLLRLNNEQRQLVGRPFLIAMMRSLFERIEQKEPAADAIDSASLQQPRQFMRVLGFDARSGTSQEDAADLSDILLTTIGTDTASFKIQNSYRYKYPVPSLEEQKQTDTTVVQLAINDIAEGSSVDSLVQANRVNEDIDPDAIADALAREPQRWLGRPLVAGELDRLRNEAQSSITTTQQILFDRDQNPPPFLPIQIKRFTYDRATQSEVKLFKRIPHSRQIEIGHVDADRKEAYSLAAVVIHVGASTSGGHYYTYVPKTINGKPVWIEFNDSIVTLHDAPEDIRKVENDIAKHGYMHYYKLAN